MCTVSLVHHRVADYDAWKQVYDSVREVQRAGGVRQHAVLGPADDPSMVVVVHTFDSPEAAHACFDSPDLKGAMERAGADMSSFRIEFLQEVEAGEVWAIATESPTVCGLAAPTRNPGADGLGSCRAPGMPGSNPPAVLAR